MVSINKTHLNSCRILELRNIMTSPSASPNQLASIKALYIEDILREIFEYLPRGFSRGRYDLARTARVCKKFSGPALDLLWRDLPDVGSLFGLFPSFTTATRLIGRDEVDFYTFNGPISQDDWSRFEYYAKRVRSLCVSFDNTDTDPSVFAQLAYHAHGRPLCPYLTSLDWIQGVVMEQSLFAFLTKSLRNLTIATMGIDESESVRSRNALTGILCMVRSGAPRLRELHLDCAYMSPSLLPLVSHLDSLQTLAISSFRSS
ncbi:hypothetical protein B0H21DRAFT_63449 [Amylocystis lapponica]|nr:hypothetical protein B0H21DRAFT_63449 [Amylocystis lapponica]